MNQEYKRLLFLCSGNYYRSRFAEVLFNEMANREGHPWRAESRGLELSSDNVGPISPHARTGLMLRGIELPPELRLPIPAVENDFHDSDHVVAIKHAEHHAMIARQFPEWLERVEFWHVHDLDCAPPEQALEELQACVCELFARLKNG